MKDLDYLSTEVAKFAASVRVGPETPHLFHPLTRQGALEACLLLAEVDMVLGSLVNVVEAAKMVDPECLDAPSPDERCGECGACYLKAMLATLDVMEPAAR